MQLLDRRLHHHGPRLWTGIAGIGCQDVFDSHHGADFDAAGETSGAAVVEVVGEGEADGESGAEVGG